ncbi:MAG: N-acetylmuramoyl-L-alanine amidase [Actinobacteria bacterium]|nr:N-acetylmuramoyl-L-alanine amidase [Actinomycetota bacterium]
MSARTTLFVAATAIAVGCLSVAPSMAQTPAHQPAVPLIASASLNSNAVTHPTWYPNWEPGVGKGNPVSWPSSWPRPRLLKPAVTGPLTGRVIVIDPGHNLGNSSHVSQINRHYWVGLNKICNTTGTQSRGGLPEATYTYDVAKRLAQRLTAAGAVVVLTRNANNWTTYGPCIQARGLLGGQVHADIEVSIHADGGPSYGRGAFVYTPARMTGYTSLAKATKSVTLAKRILSGLAANGLRGSTYLIPNVAPDRMQGTLNVSTIPTVIVETLNMRNSADAAIAESKTGRQRVADGLFEGIRQYLS